jgi:hypothetical protein
MGNSATKKHNTGGILLQNGFKLFRFSEKKIIWRISELYVPCNEDILAISDMDDFLNRTKYELRQAM